MFEHKKKLLHPVKVERPNPQYAVLIDVYKRQYMDINRG